MIEAHIANIGKIDAICVKRNKNTVAIGVMARAVTSSAATVRRYSASGGSWRSIGAIGTTVTAGEEVITAITATTTGTLTGAAGGIGMEDGGASFRKIAAFRYIFSEVPAPAWPARGSPLFSNPLFLPVEAITIAAGVSFLRFSHNNV